MKKTRLATMMTAVLSATLMAALPSVADQTPAVQTATDVVTENHYDPAAPGSTFEFDEIDLDAGTAAGSFDYRLHGANTLRGATWATPKVGPDTQTKSGTTWPKYNANEDPDYYSWGCHLVQSSTTPIGCVVNHKGSKDVVVVGSSYIGQWMPAILNVAKKEDWRVTIHTKTWCDFQPGRKITSPKPYPECDAFNNKILAKMKKDVPDIIITSHYDPTMANHMTKVYKDLTRRGVDDIVGIWNSNGVAANEGAGITKGAWCIRDTQAGKKSQYNNYRLDYRECDYGLQDISNQGNKAMRQVDMNLPSFHYIPLQDWICPEDSTVFPRCPAVIGRVVPWRDGAHLTNEWTSSMTKVVHEALYNDGVSATRPGTEDVSRVAGASRYDTSAAISALVGKGRTVYVTTGATFPDALTAGAKAGEINSAVLLVKQNGLPGSVKARLKALNPAKVVVVGSTTAISNKVRDQIKSATGVPVARVGGANRYATAANLATMPGYRTGGTVYVANGLDFPDALTTSAVAGAGTQGGGGGAAVLLVKPNAVPQDTRAALAKLRPSEIVVIGGTNAVSKSTASKLKGYSKSIHRIAGKDRYDTAAKLIEGGPKGKTVYVSVGSSFADAGSVAPVAANNGSLLLVKSTSIPRATRAALVDAQPSKIVVVGGTNAVNAKVQRDLAQYIH